MESSAQEGVGEVFVCYAHEDAASVIADLEFLKGCGIALWYDEKISGGSHWRAAIGTALDRATHVLFFVSAHSLRSDHCNREINYALDQNKVVVPISLDSTALTADLRVGLNRVQKISRASLASNDYHRRLLAALSVAVQAPPSQQPTAIGTDPHSVGEFGARSRVQSFDLIVLGSGPAGQRAAIQAAKLGKSVAIVEQGRDVGGVCINTGTLPSKTLREAVLDLSGLRQRVLYGGAYRAKKEVTVQDLLYRCDHVIRREREVIKAQLQRNGVQLLEGVARFSDAHTIAVDDGTNTYGLAAPHIVIAVGTTPGLPPGIVVDHRTVLSSDDILSLSHLPRTLTVVGAGIIGLEYATMFATLGIAVTLVDKRTEILDMVDRELVDVLTYLSRERGMTLRLGEEVAGVELTTNGHGVVVMKSGKRFATEMILVSAGRQGATAALALERAGLAADDRGRIAVNAVYQTAVPHIYAVGDVIGFPSLASTSAEQGRQAACHIFGEPVVELAGRFPYGIYSIPEIGWVGAHEAELTMKAIPFETGVARYKEIARGQILGDSEGMLKLIFHLETRKILGVWVLGSQATELVHIGQAVMAFDGTLDYFVNNVFNYPTLAECYKVAALDGMNKLRGIRSEFG